MAYDTWAPFAAPDFASPRTIAAPDLVRPWLIAGPFVVDVSKEVSGATLFERPGATENGRERYEAALPEVRAVLAGAPVEGDSVSCFGVDSRWSLLRAEEPMPHWGDYNSMNCLCATFLSTRIRGREAASHRFRVRRHIYNDVFVWMNGSRCAVSPPWPPLDPRWDDCEFEMSLSLGPRESVLSLAVLRLARVVIGGLMIEVLDGEITVRAPASRKVIHLTDGSPGGDTDDRYVVRRGAYRRRRRRALDWVLGKEDLWAQAVRCCARLDGRADVHGLDAAVIEDACDRVRRRLDCADFLLQPLLRILYAHRDGASVPAFLTELIRTTVLGFRYRQDEPGNDTMIMGSENHQIMFHVAEFLAGTLYPDEVFENSGLKGRDHHRKARALILEWLRRRGNYGFDEWHSNVYLGVTLTPLLTLFDLSPSHDDVLRSRVHALITFACYILVADTFDGAFATAHSRTYARAVIEPHTEGTAGLTWLLTGRGSLGGATMATASLATSSYAPPGILFDIDEAYATGCASTTSIQRSGVEGASFAVHRTREYMLSAVHDYAAGRLTRQTHVFQVTFRGGAKIFANAPNNSSTAGGLRPNYWVGNGTTPRVFSEAGTAVLLFENDEITWISHFYVDFDCFDEVVVEHPWLFLAKGDAYGALWSEHAFEIRRRGPYADREVLCRERSNAWVVECGERGTCGTFESFCGALRVSPPLRTANVLRYASPYTGVIEMGFTGPILVEGELRTPSTYPLVRAEFCEIEYGAGHGVLRCRGQSYPLSFD